MAASSVCGALTLLAGCASPTGTAPQPPSAATTNFTPEKRGSVTLYTDTFGDPAPQGIVAGPDNALWFTDPGNDVIGRITTTGQYTLQKPVGAEVSVGITVGLDGALWFTIQQSEAQIGRMTTGGKVTLFPDGGGAYPQGITTGPDGALWFAESNGKVGRMTTKGRVKHFSVAPSDATLKGIVTGPDGALWVAQYVVGGSRLSNQVIRVTTSGKKKSFTVGSGPQFICVGPDGALWFTESGAGAMAGLPRAVRTASIRSNPEVSFPWGSRRVPMARSGSPAAPRSSG